MRRHSSCYHGLVEEDGVNRGEAFCRKEGQLYILDCIRTANGCMMVEPILREFFLRFVSDPCYINYVFDEKKLRMIA